MYGSKNQGAEGLMAIDGLFSESGYKRVLNWLGKEKLICERCEREILPGDEYHRAGNLLIWDPVNRVERIGNPNCRFYHRSCFEEMLIEC